MQPPSRQPSSVPAALTSNYASMHGQRRMHGSCVARDDDAILIVGPPGAGKSDLVLRLLSQGFQLIADDQVDITNGIASSPPELAGLLEARGVGVVRLPYRQHARLALVVDLGTIPERLPQPIRHTELQVPLIYLDPSVASAPNRVSLALDCALGRVVQVAGAFAVEPP